MSKIVGIIPARMGSSRFYGKPLHPILEIPMLEHVYRRASMYEGWSLLCIATCDKEIADFCEGKGFPCVMTSSKHTRALDRIHEAVINLRLNLAEDDLVLNVQGDEPMMVPDMIDITTRPMIEYLDVGGTVLAMDIVDEFQYLDPNTLKIINDLEGNILYTSRSPVPYAKTFSKDIGARRIYGIFGFKWYFLKAFNALPESPLELVESCDSNRLYDNGLTQRVALYPYMPSFAVDCLEDIMLVEKHMVNDPLYKGYAGIK